MPTETLNVGYDRQRSWSNQVLKQSVSVEGLRSPDCVPALSDFCHTYFVKDCTK